MYVLVDGLEKGGGGGYEFLLPQSWQSVPNRHSANSEPAPPYEHSESTPILNNNSD